MSTAVALRLSLETAICSPSSPLVTVVVINMMWASSAFVSVGRGRGREGRGGGEGVAEETGKEKGECAERRGGRSQIELQ